MAEKSSQGESPALTAATGPGRGVLIEVYSTSLETGTARWLQWPETRSGKARATALLGKQLWVRTSLQSLSVHPLVRSYSEKSLGRPRALPCPGDDSCLNISRRPKPASTKRDSRPPSDLWSSVPLGPASPGPQPLGPSSTHTSALVPPQQPQTLLSKGGLLSGHRGPVLILLPESTPQPLEVSQSQISSAHHPQDSPPLSAQAQRVSPAGPSKDGWGSDQSNHGRGRPRGDTWYCARSGLNVPRLGEREWYPCREAS